VAVVVVAAVAMLPVVVAAAVAAKGDSAEVVPNRTSNKTSADVF
jgi:hypothetical protein